MGGLVRGLASVAPDLLEPPRQASRRRVLRVDREGLPREIEGPAIVRAFEGHPREADNRHRVAWVELGGLAEEPLGLVELADRQGPLRLEDELDHASIMATSPDSRNTPPFAMRIGRIEGHRPRHGPGQRRAAPGAPPYSVDTHTPEAASWERGGAGTTDHRRPTAPGSRAPGADGAPLAAHAVFRRYAYVGGDLFARGGSPG